MNKIMYGNVAQEPFYTPTENKQLAQCTLDNPFGERRNTPPELRSMEGVHYTIDPIAEKIKRLRAIQNINNAAIGAAVVADIYATIKAIQVVGALIWASGIIKAVLGIMDNFINDNSDEKDKLYYEKTSESSSNNQTSDTSDQIGRYKERQYARSDNAGGGDNATNDDDE